MRTKTMKVAIFCEAYYKSEIEVPVNLDLEEAMDYVEKHLDDVPLTEMEYIPCSDELDRENCYFEMEVE